MTATLTSPDPVATTPTAPDPVAARFARETAGHEMTILFDQGMYRHLRFMNPDNSACWYDLITVPGSLTFQGDGESFVFACGNDVFDFFRRSAWRGGPNPTFWVGKLTSSRAAARSYSQELFARHVAERIEESEHDYPGLFAAWDGFVSEGWYDTGSEAGARAALDAFEFAPDFGEHGPFRFAEAWEWHLDDHDGWFLWACCGICDGIARYDRAPAERAEGASS